MKQFFCILIINSLSYSVFGGVGPENPRSKIYIISIGIDDYKEKNVWGTFKYCAKDAGDIIEKIKYETEISDSITLFDTQLGKDVRRYVSIDSVISYLLTDKQASVENIREVCKKVISDKTIKPWDYFIFSFAGKTFDLSNGKSYIVPCEGSYVVAQKANSKEMDELFFSIDELALIMEQIPCRNQLIISEAGYGQEFAQNLMASLFESNPQVAKMTERNRLILTTTLAGLDGTFCPDGTKVNNGYLMHYMKKGGNLLRIFFDKYAYEFELMNQESLCRPSMEMYKSRRYIAVYSETDYRNILLKHYEKQDIMRGSGGIPVKANKEGEGKIYGLFIGTNIYNKNQNSWSDLKNPVKDTEVIARLLKAKFDVEVTELYNPSKEKVLEALAVLCNQVGEKDKFILFVAGHGYLDPNFGGALAFNDCLSLDRDKFLNSYLHMSTLQKMLDYGIKSKQVFAVFDVCFGSSFDLNAKDIIPIDYRNGLDVSIDDFIERKKEYTSRIFLASGKGEVPDYWSNSLDHSPFANRLIKALTEEKLFISPGKLYVAMAGNATESQLKRFGKHEENGDFLLKVKESINR